MSAPITNQISNVCIGFVGAGVMGSAIIKSLIKTGVSANQICVYEKDAAKAADIAANLGVNLKGINEFASTCDVLFLAVKPQDLGDLLAKLHKNLNEKTLIISYVHENKKKCKRRAKIQWCRSVFYHHVMLKFWNITILEIQAPVSSERDE